jgi:hypothetical protein
MILYSIRSERQLMEQMNYNLLFRWFVGLEMDDALIEKVFGWAKLDSVLRQVKVRGLKRVDWFYRLTMAAYNLMRLRRLIPIEALAC